MNLKPIGISFADACNKYNEKVAFECVPGNTGITKKDTKLMRQFIDNYNGMEINIEAHVKKGSKQSNPNFVRIYFAYVRDLDTPKIVVGSIGEHLDTAATRFQS
ncbi:MAG: hypothetical protein ACI4EF_07560 [Coprococcus sp.]